MGEEEKSTMWVGMKCLNEEKVVKRCISDFHDEPFCEKIIVIDGGSTDYTVQELKKFSKVQVFVHPWIDDIDFAFGEFEKPVSCHQDDSE